MTGLIVLGSLASVAMIIIYVVKQLESKQESVKEDAVHRHQVVLTVTDARRFAEHLKQCADGVYTGKEAHDPVVKFFVDNDNVIQVKVVE